MRLGHGPAGAVGLATDWNQMEYVKNTLKLSNVISVFDHYFVNNIKTQRPSHTGVRLDTVTRGRSKSPAPGISARKRR